MSESAFPITDGTWIKERGMSLRDYFAAKALLGMLSTKDWFSNNGRWASEEDMFQKYAKEAYKFADAMMEARKK